MAVARKTAKQRKITPTDTSNPNSDENVVPSGTDGRHVLVRMYNVGFGDCFLLEFPTKSKAVSRVLIDCGSVALSNFGMSDIVGQILKDVTDADGVARIDVLVCTHRHADHVSGFADKRWRDIVVKEVWFPWTENPTDKDAKSIRNRQSGLAAALQKHWEIRPAAANSDRWLSIALNALSNSSAMTMLHEGIRSKPKSLYLASDGSPVPVETEALPGVAVHTLGPSRNRDIIRDMDPPPGETYLRQVSGAADEGDIFEPFDEDWPIDPTDYQWSYAFVSQRDSAAMREAASQWDPAITVALEKAVNGTSLVLVFEMDDAVLFFPGDAQWGTWSAFLNDDKAVELLTRSKFWKVGHHGSHNATPNVFVKKTLQPFCCAMMSTKTGKWQSIPRVPLLEAIAEKGIPLARSDEPPAHPLFHWKQDAAVEARIPL